MKTHCQFVMAQLNFMVGDIEGNTEKILTAAKQAKARYQADCLLCPELALTGYPPEDLLLRQDFHDRVTKALATLQRDCPDLYLLVGHPIQRQQTMYNAASIIHPKHKPIVYAKRRLPNYGVFDEKRYFTEGNEPCIVDINGVKMGLLICEDLWDPEPSADLHALGCDCVAVINASPYDMHKPLQRSQLLAKRARDHQCPYIYVHNVGGQDEFVFDGGSLAVNADGQIAVAGDYFIETLVPASLSLDKPSRILVQTTPLPEQNPIAQAYAALVTGCRDYARKNGFEKVLLGSSGGVDSALTAAIAADALGKENVLALFLPSRFTSILSRDCHQALINALGIDAYSITIESTYQACLNSLDPLLAHQNEDITEQNIQARIRAVMLMAFSNSENRLLLATGNKSELSVGYCTLYGDMAGGFAVLKDVSKTLVYQLCHYRNQISPVIPDTIIHRAPTAELASHQADTDSLPPYHILDPILEHYIEHDRGLADIVSHGFDPAVVSQVIKMVDRAEYKRRQGAPGVRITSKAFGRERRVPITCVGQQ